MYWLYDFKFYRRVVLRSYFENCTGAADNGKVYYYDPGESVLQEGDCVFVDTLMDWS